MLNPEQRECLAFTRAKLFARSVGLTLHKINPVYVVKQIKSMWLVDTYKAAKQRAIAKQMAAQAKKAGISSTELLKLKGVNPTEDGIYHPIESELTNA